MGTLGELARVGAKRVGRHHVAARRHIGGVNLRYLLRIGKTQQLRGRTRLEARGLQHGAHAAVEQQELLSSKHRAQMVVQHGRSSRRVCRYVFVNLSKGVTPIDCRQRHINGGYPLRLTATD